MAFFGEQTFGVQPYGGIYGHIYTHVHGVGFRENWTKDYGPSKRGYTYTEIYTFKGWGSGFSKEKVYIMFDPD